MKRSFERFDSGGRGRGGAGRAGGGANNDRRGKSFFKVEFTYDPWNTLIQEKLKLKQVDESEMSKDYGLVSSTMCGTSSSAQPKVKPREPNETESTKDPKDHGLVTSTVFGAAGGKEV